MTYPRHLVSICRRLQGVVIEHRDEAQHVELLERLRSGKGRAMVAGYPSELYDRMLKGWQRIEREHMAAGSKRRRTEVLWISPG